MCFHIKGANNVCAYYLSRGTVNATIRRQISIPELSSSSSEDLQQRTVEEMSSLQSDFETERPLNLDLSDGLWKQPLHSLWIPDSAL